MTYKVVTQLTENQILELVDLFKNEFWSQKRLHRDVVKMLNASDILIGLVDENEQLIGFARVLTDFVYRATIYDVMIKSTHRQKGLGAQLFDAVINHPQLSEVEFVALYCLPEMMPFYQRWGFTDEIGELHLMYRGQKIPQEVQNDYQP
ncbi:MAG: GNAT family N-acetyltransferase [Goleter apudmare HA4340-LM2]|jgi:predicted GNAT family N-acyltransferase|nr:GNAT family N-acetyltransferase [Goleter apudmare HA4340-LM2]